MKPSKNTDALSQSLIRAIERIRNINAEDDMAGTEEVISLIIENNINLREACYIVGCLTTSGVYVTVDPNRC